jgi:hypothetical protein
LRKDPAPKKTTGAEFNSAPVIILIVFYSLPCNFSGVFLAAFAAFHIHLSFFPGIDLPAAGSADAVVGKVSWLARQEFIAAFRAS